MPLIPCPACGAKFDVTSFTPGKKLRCSKCKEVFAVPTAAANVPAAAVKQETRTSIKKKSSQVVAKPAAEEPSEAPRRPSKMIKPTKPPAEPEPEPATDEAPPKGKKKAILALVGIVVVVGGGAAMFGMPGGDDSSAMNETYAQHMAKLTSPTADDHAKVALWCLGHKDLAHAEDHLGKALAAGSKAKQLTEAATAVYWRKRFDVPATDLDKRLDLAEWCGRYGLDAFRKEEANRVLAADKGNARAQQILGAASTGGGGKEPEVDLDAEMAAKRKRDEEDKKKLASLDDWHKLSYKQFMDLRSGRQLGEKFACYDAEPPYSVFVEASDKFKAEDVGKEIHTTLKGLYDFFQKELGGKLAIEHLDAKPFIVQVFASKARYDEFAAREQQVGHPDGFLRNWGGDMTLWTWYEGTVNKPYLWHDGFHVLFSAASRAKGGPGQTSFWLDEGLALSFETAAKQGKDAIGGTNPDLLKTIQEELKLEGAKRKILGLAGMVGKQRSDVGSDLRDPTGKDPEIAAKKKAYLAQTWSMVAWLLSGDNRPKLEQLIDRELTGKGGLSAFSEVMGDTPVESAWTKFVGESK